MDHDDTPRARRVLIEKFRRYRIIHSRGMDNHDEAMKFENLSEFKIDLFIDLFLPLSSAILISIERCSESMFNFKSWNEE